MAVHLEPTAHWTRAFGGSATFTVCGWWWCDDVPDNYNVAWDMDNGSGANWIEVFFANDDVGGMIPGIWNNDVGGPRAPGPTLTGGEKIFLGAVRNGAALMLVWRLEGESVLRFSTGTVSGTISTTSLRVAAEGTVSADTTLDGGVAMVRIFESALSLSSLMVESVSALAVSTEWADWPLADTSTDTDDVSGNARSLTFNTGSGSQANDTDPDLAPDGAYVVGFLGGNTGVNDTTPTLTYPTVPGGILADDIILALTGMDGNTAVTWPGSFASIKDEAGNGSACRASVAWFRAAGGETGTFDTTQGSEGGGWQVYVIRGAHTTEAPAISTGVNSSAANGGNPDSLDPPWGTEQTLWFAAMVNDGNVAVTAGPTGYTGFANNRWANTAGAGVATAYTSTLAATENPGAFTHGAEDARSFTIGIRPADTAVVLAPADALQAQTSDNVALTQDHTLAVADAAQAQSADTPALTQVHVLVVADSAQGQTADNATVMVVTTLAPADAAQGQTADSVALTQAHALTVADSTQTQAADSPALTQAHSLVSADTSQAQSADNVTLGQVHQLEPADAAQTQGAETPPLTQVHTLVVADVVQAQTAESPTVTESGPEDLTVDDTHQGQTSDVVTLEQVHQLTVADAAQGQSADALVIAQVHVLALADTAQGQSAGSVVLGQLHVLVVADTVQAQTADTVALGAVVIPDQADHSQGTWDPGGPVVWDGGVGALVYEERTGPLIYDA